VTGNILSAKILLLVLYGRKVYDIAVKRQEARNLAVLSQFSSKAMQPNLQAYPTNRMYSMDGAGQNPSEAGYAAGAEDAAMGLCLGLATGHLSRSSSHRRSQGHREPVDGGSPGGSYNEEMFDNQQVVPCPVFPSHRSGSIRSGSRSLGEGDRELSDGEDFVNNTRYRSYSRPQSRRGSLDLSRGVQPMPPMVRRIGSRQMLVLGDEASIHGTSALFAQSTFFPLEITDQFVWVLQDVYQESRNLANLLLQKMASFTSRYTIILPMNIIHF